MGVKVTGGERRLRGGGGWGGGLECYREIHRVLPSRISLKRLREKMLKGFGWEEGGRVDGERESQFFICSGDVVVMKRNETAATMARCPLVPQPQNEAKTKCLDTPHMKPDGDTYVSCLAVHSLLMFTAVSQN